MQNLPVKNRQQKRRGAVAVEFAFVAPMLLAIALGMIELTRVYDAQYLLQSAAREGARFASMDRDGMLGEGESTNDKLVNDVKNLLASSGIPAEHIQVNIREHGTTTATPFQLDESANDLKLFDVEITVPYSSVSYMPVSTANDYGLTASITFRNGRSTISQ